MPDEKPIRFTDSPQHYLASTLSTTSGLGSNYTTNTCSSISATTQPPTPSPRRKSSGASFTELSDIQERENRTGIYVPGDYVSYQQQHAVQGGPSPGGYFGKCFATEALDSL